MGTPLEIRYETTQQDYSIAQRHIVRSAMRNYRWRFVPNLLFLCTGVLSVVGMIEIEMFKFKFDRLIDVTLLARGIVFVSSGLFTFFVALLVLNRMMLKSLFRPNGAFLSPHTMKLTEEHVLCTTRNSHSIFPYEYILRLEEDRTLLYLFIDNGMAILIPLRCFETTSDKQAFVDFITSRLSKEQPGD